MPQPQWSNGLVPLATQMAVLARRGQRDSDGIRQLKDAAGYLRAEAIKGADLAPWIKALLHALTDFHAVHVFQPIIDALVAHHVRARDWDGLVRLLEDKKRVHHVLLALNAVDRDGVDVMPAMDVVIRSQANAAHGAAQLKSLLSDLASRDAVNRVPAVIGAMRREHPRAVPGLISDLALWKKVNVSPVLHHAVEILMSAQPDSQRDAASAIRLAVDTGSDISVHFRQLFAVVSTLKPDAAELIAYALARHSILGNQQEPLGVLLNSSAPIRAGANQALGTVWLTGKRDDVEIASYVARAVVDPEERIRKSAHAAWHESTQAGRTAAPDDAALAWLILRISEGAPPEQAASCLQMFAAAKNAQAQQLLPLLADVAELEPFTRLIRLCRGDAPDQAARCSICRNLPRSSSWTHALSLPKECKTLIPVPSKGLRESEAMKRCPECDTHYVDGYTSEVDVNSMHEEFTLRRLAPSQAKAHVELPHYNAIIDAWHLKLRHLDVEERTEAAWVMALHWLTGNVHALQKELIDHIDPAVRREALETVAGEKTLVALDAALLAARLADTDARVPRWAADLLCRQRLRAGDVAGVMTLFAHPDARVQQGAFSGAWRLQSEGRDLSSFIEPIRQATQHPAEEVSRLATWMLQKIPDVGLGSKTISVAMAQLGSASVALRKQGADVLGYAARAGGDIHAAVARLAELLLDSDVAFNAQQALTISAGKNGDLRPAYPGIARALRHPGHVTNWNLQQLASGLLARDGAADIVDAFVSLVDPPKHREMPLMHLNLGIKAGADVSSGIAVIQRIADTDDHPYHREQAAHILVQHHIRRQDWKALSRLLAHKRDDVRGAACSMIQQLAATSDVSAVVPAVVAVALDEKGDFSALLTYVWGKMTTEAGSVKGVLMAVGVAKLEEETHG